MLRLVRTLGDSVNTIRANGWQLGEVADLEAQIFNLLLKFNRSIKLQVCTSPRLMQNPCYAHVLFSPLSFVVFIFYCKTYWQNHFHFNGVSKSCSWNKGQQFYNSYCFFVC